MRSKRNKGFTLVEVIVAVALVGIIAVGIIPAFAAQFKMTIDSREITATGFQAQGVMEDEIQQAKELLKGDESFGGGLPQDSISIFGRNVSLYKINKEFPLNDRKSFVVFLSEKLAEMEYRNPLVANVVRIDGEKTSGPVEQGIAVASVRNSSTLVKVKGYFEIVDYTSSQDLNLYRWYRSKEGVADPKYPDDFEFVEAWRNQKELSKDQLKEYAANRYLLLSFVPVDKSGVRGAERRSQHVYVQGEEWRSGLHAWVDKNEDGIYDTADVLVKKPTASPSNWALLKDSGFDTQNKFPNPDMTGGLLDPKNGSLYVPMGLERANYSQRIGTIKVNAPDLVINWKADKSIHFANQLEVTNDSDLRMETRDGSIRIYQQADINTSNGEARYDGEKLRLFAGGAKLKANKNIILHAGDQWGGLYLEPYTTLDSEGNIELLAAETISIAAEQSNPATPGLKATGTITLESKKKDIQIQKTMITAGKLLLKSNTKMLGGGWSSGTIVEVPDGKVLTVEVTNGALSVQNEGGLILGNMGSIVFSQGLARPLNLSLSRGDSDTVIISNDYGRNVRYADPTSGYEIIGSSGDYHNLGTGQTNLKLAIEKIRGAGSPSLSYAFDGDGKIRISASGSGGEEGYSNLYDLKVADRYAEGVVGTISFRVSAGKESPSSVEILGPGIPRHTVTFDGDGGTPASTTREVEEGTAIGAFPTVTKPSYELAGWYTEKNGGGVRITEDFVVYGPITVYANWSQKQQMTVSFYQNKSYNDFSVIATKTVRINNSIGSNFPQDPSWNSSHVFLGWNTAADGSGTQITRNTTITQDINVYAQWGIPFSSISTSNQNYIKMDRVLFQKVTSTYLLARVPIKDNNGNDTMIWSTASSQAGGYITNFEGNGSWLNSSGLLSGGTINDLSKTNILDIDISWWGASYSTNSAYYVNESGSRNTVSKISYSFACRPYIEIKSQQSGKLYGIYVWHQSDDSGTRNNPYVMYYKQ